MKRFVRVAVLLAFVLCLAVIASIHAQTPESPSAEAIRRTLEDPSRESRANDPILDDVLQIIRQRGSLLDGSSLDLAEEAVGDANTGSVKIRIAENLLRLSRKLEQITPLDSRRQEIVLQMRREAIRLIQETIGN